MLKLDIHLDLYADDEDVSGATRDLLAHLQQAGFDSRPSLVEGGVICKVHPETGEAFLRALRLWAEQRTGRRAQPERLNWNTLQGEKASLTLTVHPPAKTAATAS